MIIDNMYCLIYSSMSNPVTIARKLMANNIVVDAVLVGKADNTVLHGISYVTGLCLYITFFLLYSFLTHKINSKY